MKKICAPLCNDALLPKSMKTGLSSTELDAAKTEDEKIKPSKKKYVSFIHASSLALALALFFRSCW